MHKHAANFIISALSLQSCADLNESFLTLQHQILLLCRIFNSPELYWFTKGIVWLWQSATLLPVPELNGNMEHFWFHINTILYPSWKLVQSDCLPLKLDQSNCLFWGDFVWAPAAISLKIYFFCQRSKGTSIMYLQAILVPVLTNLTLNHLKIGCREGPLLW